MHFHSFPACFLSFCSPYSPIRVSFDDRVSTLAFLLSEIKDQRGEAVTDLNIYSVYQQNCHRKQIEKFHVSRRSLSWTVPQTEEAPWWWSKFKIAIGIIVALSSTLTNDIGTIFDSKLHARY
jgi:hypothetical protein